MKLFAIGNGSVSDYLRSNISSLKDKIASYTDEQIMSSDFDEWVEYLTKKYQVEPITFFVNATTRSLHETTIQQYNPWSRMGSAYGEPEYYNLDGYNIDFKIPFAGDSVLLKCQPSTYTFTSYEIVDFQRSTESSYGYITIRLSYTNQEIKSFGEQLEEMLMMLYNTGTRMGLIHELRLMQCYLMPDETALRELSEQVIEKLKLLTDAEFAELEFPPD